MIKILIFMALFSTLYSNPQKIDYNIDKLKEKSDVVFGYGKKEILIFASPSCIHCKSILKRISKENIMNKYTFYVFFISLTHIKNDKYKIQYIIENFNIKLIQNIEKLNIDNKNIKLNIKLLKKLNDNKMLFIKFQFTGLPEIVDLSRKVIIEKPHEYFKKGK